MSAAVDAERISGYLGSVAEKIGEFGWAVQGVVGDTPLETYCYTVGLTRRGLPELWIGSLDPDQATGFLNDLAWVLVEEGPEAYVDGALLRGRADWSMPLKIHGPCSPEAADVGVARVLGGATPTVLQVVWPDRAGLYPGDDGYDAENFPQRLLPKGRSYLVGLPVLVTVYEDGLVEYDIDTAEAGKAIREDADLDESVTEEMVRADAELVDADHERRNG